MLQLQLQLQRRHLEPSDPRGRAFSVGRALSTHENSQNSRAAVTSSRELGFDNRVISRHLPLPPSCLPPPPRHHHHCLRSGENHDRARSLARRAPEPRKVARYFGCSASPPAPVVGARHPGASGKGQDAPEEGGGREGGGGVAVFLKPGLYLNLSVLLWTRRVAISGHAPSIRARSGDRPIDSIFYSLLSPTGSARVTPAGRPDDPRAGFLGGRPGRERG